MRSHLPISNGLKGRSIRDPNLDQADLLTSSGQPSWIIDRTLSSIRSYRTFLGKVKPIFFATLSGDCTGEDSFLPLNQPLATRKDNLQCSQNSLSILRFDAAAQF